MSGVDADFFTIGYGRWDAKRRWERLVTALRGAGVDLLVDVRHSPCASDLDPANPYGARAWHVQAAGAGIEANLREAGIEYRWVVELGNPQKRDPAMAVLLGHLADPGGRWPVHRGLAMVQGMIARENRRLALMCACPDVAHCHRRVVAEALLERLPPGARWRDLSAGRP